MSDIRIGIIGTNFISDRFMASIREVSGIEACAVLSRKQDTADSFAEKHSLPFAFSDPVSFYSSEIDAVYIASPNMCHFGQTMAAFGHGKHVLVEKPGATDSALFSRMVEEAKRRGLVLLEAMRPAHDPAMEEVRRHLDEISPIRKASLDFCQYSSRYDRYKEGIVLNAFDPSLGNAAVMDIGVYPICTAVSLFGYPDGIVSRSFILPNGMEGHGTVLLSYEGFTCTVTYSKICDSSAPSEVTGEKGSVRIGKISSLDNTEVIMRSGDTVSVPVIGGEKNMRYEIEHFRDMINGLMSPDAYNEGTLSVLRITDEIRRQNGIKFE